MDCLQERDSPNRSNGRTVLANRFGANRRHAVAPSSSGSVATLSFCGVRCWVGAQTSPRSRKRRASPGDDAVGGCAARREIDLQLGGSPQVQSLAIAGHRRHPPCRSSAKGNSPGEASRQPIAHRVTICFQCVGRSVIPSVRLAKEGGEKGSHVERSVSGC